MKCPLPLVILCGWLALIPASAADLNANSRESGVITGRVFNLSSGNYLNNAKIVVQGTTLETYSNEIGEYRLSNVPAGSVVLNASFVGLSPQAPTVQVAAGQVTTYDFRMSLVRLGADPANDTVKLEAFTVVEREMSGLAIALHEQRTAPNIKNVVSMDEFGDLGEGNVGEFLKFVPGLNVSYTPNYPQFISIRGMPASGTLVMVDGATAASSTTGNRQFDLGTAVAGNIDRMEVTKTPTPDLPANAVGGSINLISKSGFSRQTPLLSYEVFATFNQLGGVEEFHPRLGKAAGPDSKSTTPYIQPAFNISYILPLTKSLAFTFASSYAARRSDQIVMTPTWDRVKLIQTTNQTNDTVSEEIPKMISGKIEWKAGERDFFSASYVHSDKAKLVRQSTITATMGAGATGGSTFTQGASTGVGSVTQAFNNWSETRLLDHATLSYRHDADRWKMDASLAYSAGSYSKIDVDDGFFSTITTTGPTAILRMDGLDGIMDMKIPHITGVTTAGRPVDLFNGRNLSITAATSAPLEGRNEILRAAANVSRDFQLAVPFSVKSGVVLDQQERDVTGGNSSWTFNPPNGTAGRLASNYDVVDDKYTARWYFTDTSGNKVRPQFLSSTKVFNIYQANPQWFTLNDASKYTSVVTSSKRLEETIEAAYVRTDVKLLSNRLWIVTGVRFEHTGTDGLGPLNDLAATYVKNRDGSIARDSAGRPIPITTNALEKAKLQYTERGAHAKRSYSGYYPSLNSSYNVTPDIVVRAAYARTIGRPNLAEIIPGLTITDPGSDEANRTITVINSGLKPWTADNYDLTAEAYNIKGAVVSVSLFQKNIKDFFASYRTPATPELLEAYGLSPDYLDYDIITKQNAGSASISGVELNYRQSLALMGAWARGLQVFGNVTSMSLSGPDKDNFSDFSSRNINWGVTYARSRFLFNVNASLTKWVRQTVVAANATTPAGSYTYREPITRTGVSIEYRFTKRFTVYSSVRNLMGSLVRTTIRSPGAPGYAAPSSYVYSPAVFTLGVKGAL